MTPRERKMYRQERLVALLHEKYEGQQIALANAAEISATLVSRYIGGTKGIGEDMVSKIEKNTGYLGWFGIHQTEDTNEAPTPKVRTSTQKAPRGGAVFHLLDVEAACGDGRQNSDYPEIVRSIVLSNEEARDRIGSLNKSGSIQVIVATGDSMVPTIQPHDLLFVDTAVTEFAGDGIYLIRRDHGLSCKRISMTGRTILVTSDNPVARDWKWKDKQESDAIIGRVLAALPMTFRQF